MARVASSRGIRSLCYELSLVAASLMGAVAQAQSSPPRAVRVIVPFLGGGVIDNVARVVIAKLEATSRRPFVVANRPGDGGHFGAEVVAKAEPDGYVLLFAPTAEYAAAAANPRVILHYNLLADFAPVTLVANAPHVLAAHPSLPAKTVAALIAVAKARPGFIKWTFHGVASLSHLELELFATLGGIDVGRAPSPTALSDLIAGNVELLFENIAVTLPHTKTGKLRALAVASSKRSPAIPALPTVAESGVAGFAADRWYAVLAPEGVDSSVINRLNSEIGKALEAADVRERLIADGIEARGSTPAVLAAIMREDIAKWAKVIKTLR